MGGASVVAVLLACAVLVLNGGGRSSSTEFANLDQQKADAKVTPLSRLSAKDAKPLGARRADKVRSFAIPEQRLQDRPADVVEFAAFKVPELNAHRTGERRAAPINLPLVGEVPAAGGMRTRSSAISRTMLSGRDMQLLQATASSRSTTAQRATVEGAVKRPGVYPARQHLAVLQWATPYSRGSRHGGFRHHRPRVPHVEGKRMARVDIGHTQRRRQRPGDRVGDVIVVPRRAMKGMFRSDLEEVFCRSQRLLPLLL